jgi:hypothetical protein
MPESSCNRWVFREGRSRVRTETVRSGLAASAARLNDPTADRLIDALIRAGELETALADMGSREAELASQITDAMAAALVDPEARRNLDALAPIIDGIEVPEQVELATPEGFAYYALHPRAYAALINEIGLRSPVAVIGIRSIGTTLSAVVAAALRMKAVRAARVTVRPTGHPYDRKTEFTAAVLRWIAWHRHHRAEFLVVDEGPGLSGSSFLSVGEALLAAGVERRRIRFLCSHKADADLFTTPRGAERWRGFQTDCVRMVHRPTEGVIDCGGGEWRRIFPTHRAGDCKRPEEPGGARYRAPESSLNSGSPTWTYFERMKFLSSDRRRLYKFAGFGRFGEAVAERAQVLAASGFGPKFFGVHEGYAEYEMVAGSPARREDLSRALVERIADYCALRASEFRVGRDSSPLEAMARFNYEQEFGEEAPEWLRLESAPCVVVCDGRMLRHEWILTREGTAIKTDGETHGDDHFFPGPSDIAWDLAGAIVEWEMDRGAEEALLDRFASRNGGTVGSRIRAYKLAYAVFRMSYCSMAAHALRGTEEYVRLTAEAERYRAMIAEMVQRMASAEVIRR